jgi:hypothetical protein
MNTPWKIIYGYKLNPKTNAQAVYDDLIRSALTYKFRGVKNLAVPVDGRTITEAIFGLNAHDEVSIKGGQMTISGQKLKELFITTIFLKRLESRFKHEDDIFIVLPESETSVDTAVMVVEAGSKMTPLNPKLLKLTREHIPFEFQIKEYFDFSRLTQDTFLIPVGVNLGKIEEVAGHYTESTLIFLRELLNYQSEDMEKFFQDHPNCYLISATNQVTVDGRNIPLDESKHNYAITYPGNTMSLESFELPRFLFTGVR